MKGPPDFLKSGSDKTWESSTGQRSPLYTNPCTSRVCAAKPKVRRNCIRRNCTPHPHPKQTSDNSVYTPPPPPHPQRASDDSARPPPPPPAPDDSEHPLHPPSITCTHQTDIHTYPLAASCLCQGLMSVQVLPYSRSRDAASLIQNLLITLRAALSLSLFSTTADYTRKQPVLAFILTRTDEALSVICQKPEAHPNLIPGALVSERCRSKPILGAC